MTDRTRGAHFNLYQPFTPPGAHASGGVFAFTGVPSIPERLAQDRDGILKFGKIRDGLTAPISFVRKETAAFGR